MVCSLRGAACWPKRAGGEEGGGEEGGGESRRRGSSCWTQVQVEKEEEERAGGESRRSRSRRRGSSCRTQAQVEEEEKKEEQDRAGGVGAGGEDPPA